MWTVAADRPITDQEDWLGLSVGGLHSPDEPGELPQRPQAVMTDKPYLVIISRVAPYQ